MRKNESFCGWYFRCRAGEKTLALIPAAHTAEGRTTGSLQIITRDRCWNVPFSGEETAVAEAEPRAVLDRNIFCGRGLRLELERVGLSARGVLRFGPPAPPRYDVMGPFCGVPGMECRHRVFSFRHRVDGLLTLNGEEYRFEQGTGYIEGDRGCSFPRQYLWTQADFPGGALMLSAAEIPLGPVRFTGVIGAVLLGGRELRLASYLGGRAARIGGGRILVRQGPLTLEAACLEPPRNTLCAPAAGAMRRAIRENVSCRARYRLARSGKTLLGFETDGAAFEYEYPW